MIKFLTSGTAEIVEAHKADFDCTNYESKLKSAGGYRAYIKSLGGVFADYLDYSSKVTSVKDFYAVLDYVFGLFSIYGFDYYNGKTYVRYPDKPFYVNGKKGKCNSGKIDDLCSLSSKSKTTCCNWAIDSALYKMGWLPNGKQTMCTYASYGTLITSKSDLKAGDIVHFYRDPNKVFNPNNTSTYSKSGWHHVVLVVSVTDDTIVVADGGSRMQKNSGQWLYEVPKTGTGFGGTYGTSDKWMARRIADMTTVPTKDGKTADDMAIECILGHDINGATWGNGDARKSNLGDMYDEVQSRINAMLKDESVLKIVLAKHILEGKAGSGSKREDYLGQYYSLGQDAINEIDAACKTFFAGYSEAYQEVIKMYLKIIL